MTKRFGQVIISSLVQAGNAIRFVAARGQHQNGHVGSVTNAAQHLEAIHAGQHDVEDDGVDFIRPSQFQDSRKSAVGRRNSRFVNKIPGQMAQAHDSLDRSATLVANEERLTDSFCTGARNALMATAQSHSKYPFGNRRCSLARRESGAKL